MAQVFPTCRCGPKGLLCFGMTVPAMSESEQTSVRTGTFKQCWENWSGHEPDLLSMLEGGRLLSRAFEHPWLQDVQEPEELHHYQVSLSTPAIMPVVSDQNNAEVSISQ